MMLVLDELELLQGVAELGNGHSSDPHLEYRVDSWVIWLS
jgi:hypothetical protein